MKQWFITAFKFTWLPIIIGLIWYVSKYYPSIMGIVGYIFVGLIAFSLVGAIGFGIYEIILENLRDSSNNKKKDV